ncbi:MAG: RNA 3'-terminal phosphate cyclase [Bradymonadaceae bacterium]
MATEESRRQAVVTMDGSQGEGGGQILRTSLALSMLTGKPFRIVDVRAGRKRPGLMRQHLTAVEAAAKIASATVVGAAIGSTEIVFEPGEVSSGEYHFSIGTAGSTMLVLQTILFPLALARGPSVLLLEGGTHNIHAPPLDFIERAFLPVINSLGPKITVRAERVGFYPAGGGRVVVEIEPAPAIAPLSLLERGKVQERLVRGLVAHLPVSIARREVLTFCELLRWPPQLSTVVEVEESDGPGNILLVEIGCEHVREVFSRVGQKGVPSEKVAALCAEEVLDYLSREAPVGPHLADQLLLPMALARAGAIRTGPLTGHSLTQIETIQRFLDVEFEVHDEGAGVHHVQVRPRR